MEQVSFTTFVQSNTVRQLIRSHRRCITHLNARNKSVIKQKKLTLKNSSQSKNQNSSHFSVNHKSFEITQIQKEVYIPLKQVNTKNQTTINDRIKQKSQQKKQNKEYKLDIFKIMEERRMIMNDELNRQDCKPQIEKITSVTQFFIKIQNIIDQNSNLIFQQRGKNQKVLNIFQKITHNLQMNMKTCLNNWRIKAHNQTYQEKLKQHQLYLVKNFIRLFREYQIKKISLTFYRNYRFERKKRDQQQSKRQILILGKYYNKIENIQIDKLRYFFKKMKLLVELDNKVNTKYILVDNQNKICSSFDKNIKKLNDFSVYQQKENISLRNNLNQIFKLKKNCQIDQECEHKLKIRM